VPAPSGSPLVVVSAAVVLFGGRVLLTQRKRGTHLAGAWEFPGGKVEPDEDPCAALVRELAEEIGVTAEVGDIVAVTFHRYPAKNVLLLFYEARLAPGSPEPRAIDVAAVRWAEAAELRDEDFPPADVAVLAKVRAKLQQRDR
jgi:8-oxo-dGTP diphosphatase